MTFGPGSTYGEEGAGAAGAYMVLTWIGIVVMVRRPRLAGWSTRTGLLGVAVRARRAPRTARHSPEAQEEP